MCVYTLGEINLYHRPVYLEHFTQQKLFLKNVGLYVSVMLLLQSTCAAAQAITSGKYRD